MTTKVRSQSEYYDIYKNEVLAHPSGSEFTDFSDGSMHDIVAGALSISMNELSELTLTEFAKTFFDQANGPEITQGDDDLQVLAIDHFGERFARPEAEQASTDYTFSRPNADAGNIVIPAGTIVKTAKDINGEEISFATVEDVTLVGLTVTVGIEATVAGKDGNVEPNTITIIESALTDPSITGTNTTSSAGGTDEQSDAEYRETIRSLIESLAGATEDAILGAVLALPSVSFASAVTLIKAVREWDISGDAPIGDVFRFPFIEVYVADEDGNSSQQIIDEANTEVFKVKAGGVKIVVNGGTSTSIDWDASISLNPLGPNYATLQNDTTMIEESMQSYINEVLDIGEGFDRISARSYIISIWGPAGTGDLTNFVINTPTGNVIGQTGVKLIAGTMGIS